MEVADAANVKPKSINATIPASKIRLPVSIVPLLLDLIIHKSNEIKATAVP
jgi:hypothetical protein